MTYSPTVPAVDQQYFLDMYARILPPNYLQPLQAIGPGYEMFQGFAAVGARVSTAQQNLGSDLGFLTATGGNYAVGTVQLSRPALPTSGQAVPNQFGYTAEIISGASAGNMRVSGVFNMSSADIDNFLALSNCFYEQNVGTFRIVAIVSPSVVDVANASAIVPDLTGANVYWQEQDLTVTVKAGTVVTTSDGGADFVTQADQIFLWSDLGPFDVTVQSVAQDYAYNVNGQFVSAGGETIPGEIDTIKTLIEDPPFQDTTIQVSNLLPTTGGKDDALGALGADRNLPRKPNEQDGPYRARLRQLPQAVTPVAIQNAVEALFSPINASFSIIETWAPTLQTCWDAPNATIAGSEFDPTLFCWDDPRPNFPFQDRWLDDSCVMAGIVVVVEDVQPIYDTGMAWDDPTTNAAELQSSNTGGYRAISAWDQPANVQQWGYIPGAWDGYDQQKNALYLGLWQTLQQIKPAGNPVYVELEGQ